MRVHKDNEKGFTIPELLIVLAVFVILAVFSTRALKPVPLTTELQDARRHIDIAQLAQNLQRYKAENGQFPPNLPDFANPISSLPGQYNLCSFLVPKYLKDLPLDPLVSAKLFYDQDAKPDQPCSLKGIEYVTGYTIMYRDNVLTLAAPAASHEKIEIKIR